MNALVTSERNIWIFFSVVPKSMASHFFSALRTIRHGSCFVCSLQRLYALGARKFVVFSIQPTGCTPVVRSFLNITGAACIEPVNDAVALFNSELRRLVDGARSRMPAARLAYIDSYKIIKDKQDTGFVPVATPVIPSFQL